MESGKQRSFGKKIITPKTMNQRRYIDAIEHHDLVFGIGPAGTGKTYLAVAMAVVRAALKARQPHRPDPARGRSRRAPGLPARHIAGKSRSVSCVRCTTRCYDMIEAEKVEKLLERNTIEVAPIAFMRGRTLNDSFIIMDEAQNTTPEQMKMILTRQGFNSKMVVTGDVTQIDLPHGTAQRIGRSGGCSARRRRHQLRPVRRPRRGAPQPGAEDRQGLRALQRSRSARIASCRSNWLDTSSPPRSAAEPVQLASSAVA